jgi:DNA-binding GntR family transcriptional regulator
MSVTPKEQDFWSSSIYDRLVTAAPLELDATPTSLADRAYLAIRDQLIMLDIQPGEPIDDDQLAKSLGVGRTPVRGR